MPSVVVWAMALLAPVGALLFSGLRRRRTIRFPHDYFAFAGRRSPFNLLVRVFRARYDLIFDAACAIVVAFAVCGYPLPPERPASVIDGSRSMLSGPAGSRALDDAVKSVLALPPARRGRVFLLAAPPGGGESRPVDVSRAFRGKKAASAPDASGIAATLAGAYAFSGADYTAMAALRRSGYGSITLFTDKAPFVPADFEAVESGFRGSPFAYPVSGRHGDASSKPVVYFAVDSPAVAATFLEPASGGAFRRLGAGEASVRIGRQGMEAEFANPGIYAVRFGEDMLAFKVPDPLTAPGASGKFSESALEAFGGQQGTQRVVFQDQDARRAIPSGTCVLVTRLSSGPDPLLLPPRSAFGALIPVSPPEGADVSPGRAALASNSLSLFYYYAILEAAAASPVKRIPEGTWDVMGSSIVFPASGRVVSPPASEYLAPPDRLPGLALGIASPPGWPVWAALALLYAAKPLLKRRFTSPDAPLGTGSTRGAARRNRA